MSDDLQVIFYDEDTISVLLQQSDTINTVGKIEDYLEAIAKSEALKFNVAKKSLTFTDSNLSVAGLLIWQHDLNRAITSFRLTQVSTGIDFNITWDEPNPNTVRIDFGNEPRPIPGTWQLTIFAA